jgi:hypothetical protein
MHAYIACLLGGSVLHRYGIGERFCFSSQLLDT